MTETDGGLKTEAVPLSRMATSVRQYDEGSCSVLIPQGDFNDSVTNPIIHLEQPPSRHSPYDMESRKVSPFRPTPSTLHRMDTTIDSTIDADANDDSISLVSRLSYSRRRRRRDFCGPVDAAEEERQRQELEKALKNLEEMQRENKERMMRIGSTMASTHSAHTTGRRASYDDQGPEQYLRTQSVGVHLTREVLRLQMFERAATSLTVPDPLMEAINSSRRQRCKGSANKLTSPKTKRNGLWMASSNKKNGESPARQSQCLAPNSLATCASAESLSVKKDVNAGKNPPAATQVLTTSKELTAEQHYGNGKATVANGGGRANNGNNRGMNSSVSPASSKDDPQDQLLSSAGDVKSVKRAGNQGKRTVGGGRPSSGRPSGRSSSPPIIILTVDARRHMGEEDARRLLSAKPLEGYESHSHLRHSMDTSVLSNTTVKRAAPHASKATEPFAPMPSTVIAERESESRGKVTPPEVRRNRQTSETRTSPVSTIALTPASHADGFLTRDEVNRKSGSVQLHLQTTQQPLTKNQSATTTATSPQAEKKKKVSQAGVATRTQQPAKQRSGKVTNASLKSPGGSAGDGKVKPLRTQIQPTAGTARTDRRNGVVHRSSFPRTGVEPLTQQRTIINFGSSHNQTSPLSHGESPYPIYDKDGRRVKNSHYKLGQTTVTNTTTTTATASNAPVVTATANAAVVAVTTVRQRSTVGNLKIRRKSFTSLSPTASTERESMRPLATDRPQATTLNTVRCVAPAQQQPTKQLVPFCTECGKRHLDDKVKFCAFCGHKRELA